MFRLLSVSLLAMMCFVGSWVSAQTTTLVEPIYNASNQDIEITKRLTTLVTSQSSLIKQQPYVSILKRLSSSSQLRIRWITTVSYNQIILYWDTKALANKALSNPYYRQYLETAVKQRDQKSISDESPLIEDGKGLKIRYQASDTYTQDMIHIIRTNMMGGADVGKSFPLSYNQSNAKIVANMKKETIDFRTNLLVNEGLVWSRFLTLSPSGYYVSMRLGGYEYSEAIMMDTSNGKTVLRYSPGIETWTTDRKQFVRGSDIGMGGGELGLNMTKVGAFPALTIIMKDRQIEDIIVDADRLIIVSSLLESEQSSYYFSIVSPATYTVLEEYQMKR